MDGAGGDRRPDREHRPGDGCHLPTVRYHPAIIAQAAATLALVSEGRFTLGVGSGERLNEHVVGEGFPVAVRVRHRMLREALEIIRLLWRGGYHSYQGDYLQLSDARVFDLPDELPPIAVAAGGPAAARLAAELGDWHLRHRAAAGPGGQYQRAGGDGPATPRYRWPGPRTRTDGGRRRPWTTSRWAVTGWKVMSELPNPANFAAATGTVREDGHPRPVHVRPRTPTSYVRGGPAVSSTPASIASVLMNAGPDPDGFLEFFGEQLADRLRA